MLEPMDTNPRLLNRAIDFAVLGVTFFLSCQLLSVDIGSGMALQTLLYASILLIFVRLSKRVMLDFKHNTGSVAWQIIGNAMGIFAGTAVMLVLEKFLVGSRDIIVAVVFSGVMAFFILGTLSPLFNKNTPQT